MVPSQWRHADCLAVRDLLTFLQQHAAAETWTQRCAQKFEWSAAFGGAKRLPLEEPMVAAAAPSPEAALTNGFGGLKFEK